MFSNFSVILKNKNYKYDNQLKYWAIMAHFAPCVTNIKFLGDDHEGLKKRF